MADFLAPPRRFFIHSAHRAVGVLGARPMLSSSGAAESWKTECEPKLLLLVADAKDYRMQSSLALFERILLGRGRVQCRRVPFASAGVERLLGADATLIFNRGFHAVRGWAESDFASPAENGPVSSATLEMELETAAEGRHPILEGVGSFKTCCPTAPPPHIARQFTCLLTGRALQQTYPLAWAWTGVGRAFSTLLGRPEDFRRPAFVRLALNAVDWVSER